MTKPSPDCAIRQAYVRFGLVYWGGAFLLSLIFYVLKIADFADFARHGWYVAEKVLRYACGWVFTTAISYVLWRIHRWAGRRGPLESALPVFIVAAFLISLAAALVWAGYWGW